jgi:hypothetical protein
MIQLRKISCCKRMPSFARWHFAPQLGEVHEEVISRLPRLAARLRLLGRIAILTNPAAAI